MRQRISKLNTREDMDYMDTISNRRKWMVDSAQRDYGIDNHLIEIPFDQCKAFTGYFSIREDLRLVLEYINALRNKPDKVVEKALQAAAITLYGKCFTDAAQSKMPKLEPMELFGSEARHKEIHDYVMQLRHTFTAHRGSSGEVIIAYYVLPKNGDLDQAGISIERAAITSFKPDVLQKFEELVLFVIDVVEKKYRKTIDRAQKYCEDTYVPKQPM